MKLVKTIVNILANVCYVGIIVYVLIALPTIFGYHPLIVLSGSMEPTYPVDSVLYYKAVAQEELKEKDVITYEIDSGEYITHRIEKIDNGSYQTKGDANETVDANFVEYSQIKGKVASIHIPIIGKYIKFVNENRFIIFIVAIILISEFFLQNKKDLDIYENLEEKEGKN